MIVVRVKNSYTEEDLKNMRNGKDVEVELTVKKLAPFMEKCPADMYDVLKHISMLDDAKRKARGRARAKSR